MRKFPVLHQLPLIKILNLNTNKIVSFKADFKPPSSLSLMVLDIGNNQIEFSSKSEFFENFLEKGFKKLKNIKQLSIENNPMIPASGMSGDDHSLLEIVATQLPQLEFLNNNPVKTYKVFHDMEQIENDSMIDTSSISKSMRM